MATQERAALPRGSPAGTNPAGVRASLQRARPRAVTGQLDAGEFSGEVFGRSQYYSHFSPTLAPQRARKTNGPAGITCRAAMLMREGKKFLKLISRPDIAVTPQIDTRGSRNVIVSKQGSRIIDPVKEIDNTY